MLTVQRTSLILVLLTATGCVTYRGHFGYARTDLSRLHAGMHMEERNNIQKFGEDYERYMQRVPRINAILGLIRLMRRRDGAQKNTD